MNYLNPKTEQEFLDLITKQNDYYILNGGTDLLVQYNEQLLDYDYTFIDISKLAELNYIEEDENNVYIGANVKYAQIEYNEIIKKYFPSIVYAASEVGSRQIRNLGTIVGNICNSSPGGDLPVVLAALDARVIVKSQNCEREYDIDTFISGFRQNILNQGEYVSKVIIPKKRKYSFYEKYGVGHKRKVIISNAGMAVAFNINDSKLSDVHVVFGACDIKFRKMEACNKFLEGKTNVNLEEWLELVEVELNNLTAEKFVKIKTGHLKACAVDAYDYIIESLEV